MFDKELDRLEEALDALKERIEETSEHTEEGEEPKEYDAVIAPIMATDAIDHDHGRYGERTIMVDNDERPYFEQIFWAGIAINSYLPSTVIPTGLSDNGLPIGIQIIGPEFGDLKTIGLAKLLEKEGYKFQAPKNYPD